MARVRELIQRARQEGDPRWLGMAEAALARWRGAPAPPDEVLLLRATLLQSRHDFEGALRDLAALLNRDPAHAQAWLTRASVERVMGRYSDAVRSCTRLWGLRRDLIAEACLADARQLVGSDSAYRYLQSRAGALAEAPGDVSSAWVLTVLAEMAERAGDPAAAQEYFRRSLRWRAISTLRSRWPTCFWQLASRCRHGRCSSPHRRLTPCCCGGLAQHSRPRCPVRAHCISRSKSAWPQTGRAATTRMGGNRRGSRCIWPRIRCKRSNWPNGTGSASANRRMRCCWPRRLARAGATICSPCCAKRCERADRMMRASPADGAPVMTPRHAHPWLAGLVWLVLACGIGLASGPAAAHKASDAYLSVIEDGPQATLLWEIGLRDLGLRLDLDVDRDNTLNPRELAAGRPAIDALALSSLTVTRGGSAHPVGDRHDFLPRR
jgi:hypothetical protein